MEERREITEFIEEFVKGGLIKIEKIGDFVYVEDIYNKKFRYHIPSNMMYMDSTEE